MSTLFKSLSATLLLCSIAVGANSAVIHNSSYMFYGLPDADDRVMVDLLNNRAWMRWDLIENVTSTYQDVLDFTSGSEWNIGTIHDALSFAEAIVLPVNNQSGNQCIFNGPYGQICGTTQENVDLITGSSFAGLTYAKFLNDSQFDTIKDIGVIYSDGGTTLQIAENYLTIPEADATLTGPMGWLLWADLPPRGDVPVPGALYLVGLGLLLILGQRKRS